MFGCNIEGWSLEAHVAIDQLIVQVFEADFEDLSLDLQIDLLAFALLETT